jgi:alpha-glucoside transport system substrate-binding protein
MRRPLWTLVVTVALVAAGCGGDGEETAEQPPPATPQTLADLRGHTLEVAAVWSGDEQANFGRVLDRFKERTGAQVRFTSTGDDIATELGTRSQGGQPPDVAVLPQPGLLTDLVRRNALRPVDDVAGSLVDENYAPIWRRLGTGPDGRLYGVWFKAANKSTFWYRTKALADAGVAPPRDWEELKRVAATLRDSGVTPLAVGAGDGWTLTDWFENVYLRTAGPERYDRLARHEIPWTDPSVKRALITMAEVLGRQEWLVGGANGALATNFDRSVVQVFGEHPQAAMTFEADFVAVNITKDTRSRVGVDAKVFDFPAIGASPPSVVSGGDVAVVLKDSPAGRELVKFLATPEAAEVWARAGGFVSANENLDQTAYPDETTRQAARALTQADVVRFDLSDLVPSSFGATTGQGLWKVLQDWLRAPANVDAIAAQLEAAAARAGR